MPFVILPVLFSYSPAPRVLLLASLVSFCSAVSTSLISLSLVYILSLFLLLCVTSLSALLTVCLSLMFSYLVFPLYPYLLLVHNLVYINKAVLMSSCSVCGVRCAGPVWVSLQLHPVEEENQLARERERDGHNNNSQIYDRTRSLVFIHVTADRSSWMNFEVHRAILCSNSARCCKTDQTVLHSPNG